MRRWLRPLLAVSVFLWTVSANALTLAQIRTAVRLNIRDTATSTALQRYSDSTLNTLINEGQRAVAMRAWPMTKTNTLTASASTVYYTMPSDTLAIRRVTYNGVVLPEVTQQQIDADQNYGSWESSTTTTTPKYWFRGNQNSTNSIGLYPAPASSGATVLVYYASAPTDLSADSDVPFESETRFSSYHDLLVFYATERIEMIEGLTDKAQMFQGFFDTELETFSENIGLRPQVVPAIPTKENKK